MQFKVLFLIQLMASGLLLATDAYDREEVKRLLGYDPRITMIAERDAAVVPSGRKTVYFHGFGASGDDAVVVKHHYGARRLPGEVVTFDFADAVGVGSGGMDTSKSSLGQWNDIKTALYVLNRLRASGETQIGITAHSRGGATAVNMVAALVDRTGKYDTRFAELGIDVGQRRAILGMLQAGHIVLECPLADVRSVIRHQVEAQIESSTGSSWLGRLFGSSLRSSGSIRATAASVDHGASLVLKKYRAGGEQAIKSAEKWNHAGIPTIVHFQDPDEVLGGDRNEEFYAKLSRSNGEERTFWHIGNDGGHNSSFDSFVGPRNDFLREHGGAYIHTRDSLK